MVAEPRFHVPFCEVNPNGFGLICENLAETSFVEGGFYTKKKRKKKTAFGSIRRPKRQSSPVTLSPCEFLSVCVRGRDRGVVLVFWLCEEIMLSASANEVVSSGATYF